MDNTPIHQTLCGPGSSVDWGYPETGQVQSVKDRLIEKLRNCDRKALARRLAQNKPARDAEEKRRKQERGVSKETLDLRFEI